MCYPLHVSVTEQTLRKSVCLKIIAPCVYHFLTDAQVIIMTECHFYLKSKTTSFELRLAPVKKRRLQSRSAYRGSIHLQSRFRSDDPNDLYFVQAKKLLQEQVSTCLLALVQASQLIQVIGLPNSNQQYKPKSLYKSKQASTCLLLYRLPNCTIDWQQMPINCTFSHKVGNLYGKAQDCSFLNKLFILSGKV